MGGPLFGSGKDNQLRVVSLKPDVVVRMLHREMVNVYLIDPCDPFQVHWVGNRKNFPFALLLSAVTRKEANTGRPSEESSTPRVDKSRAKLIWKGIRELKEAVRVLWEDLCPSGNDL
jgi:hypothetical protein